MKATCDILVIDDEQVVLQGITRICVSEGLRVDAVSSSRAGLERLEKSDFRLIICDIMMGDLDGLEFLAEAGRRGHRVPVVMSTGNSTVQNAVRSIQCGAIDYLPKPFTVDELMAVVSRGLNYEALQTMGPKAKQDAKPCPPHLHCLGYVSWAATESVGTVLIGANDLFVKTLKGIRSIELLPVGTELIQGSACTAIVSADGLAHNVMCPVSGQIIDTHAEVVAQPSILEMDPYGAGWFYRILPSDLEFSLRSLTSQSVTSDQQNFQRKGDPT